MGDGSSVIGQRNSPHPRSSITHPPSPITQKEQLYYSQRITNDAVLRKIIHVDMDAFYASVEQRDHPQYRGRPLVVGGGPHSRGVVAAASYEARKFGIHSAMPSRLAAKRCPHLIFAKLRFDVYREVSGQIREIFHSYTDLVEPLSLDEAYLDVTAHPRGSAMAIAREMPGKSAVANEALLVRYPSLAG